VTFFSAAASCAWASASAMAASTLALPKSSTLSTANAPPTARAAFLAKEPILSLAGVRRRLVDLAGELRRVGQELGDDRSDPRPSPYRRVVRFARSWALISSRM
jgi:hypothetical protein